MASSKRPKRIIAAVAAAFLLALSFCSCAGNSSCAGSGPDGGEPSVSPAPQVSYKTTHMIKYWPEDSDYTTCDYSCVVEIPQFDQTFTAGYSMNEAVSDYIKDIDERIEKQYMPKAVEKKPHTEVTCEVEYLPGCTNVIFHEEHSGGERLARQTWVLMLDDYGKEINVCDLILSYHAEKLVAVKVAEELGSDPVRAISAIDLTHGARATLAGVEVFVREGIITPYEDGEQAVNISFDELVPSFVGVGKTLSLKEYRSLTELLHFVSDAAVVRQENIAAGALSEFEAASFMGEYCLTLGYYPSAGRVNVPEQEFEGCFRSIFGTEYPGTDKDGHDIKKENGYYAVLNSKKQYEYHIDILFVTESDGVLSVSGDMMFGPFGYAFTSYVCHVNVTLVRSAESPFGFRLIDYTMSL